MPTKPNRGLCIRRSPRHTAPREYQERLEVFVTSPGSWRVPVALREISHTGMSFSSPVELSGVHRFALLDVEIRLGKVTLDAEMLVAHLASEPNTPVVCGGSLQPKTEADRHQLREILAALGARDESRAEAALPQTP